MPKLSVAFTVSVGGLSLLAPALAQAHFLLNSPTSWWTQASDGSPQKTPPCGNETTANTMASKVITKFTPGQQVPVTVQSTIAHPGWWRISLKQGASSTQTMSTLPDPPNLGAAGTAQQCTPAFIDNPVWSPTQPVIADKLGIPAGSTSTTTNQSGTKTFMVTIPSNATCTSASPCTLQVLMFMTDHPAGSCLYHHCADIAVEGATGTGGSGGGAGGTGAGGTTGGASGGRGGAAGMTTGTGGRGGAPGTGQAGSTGAAGASATGGTTGGTSGTTGSGGGAGTGPGSAGADGTQGSAGATGSPGTAGTTGSGGATGAAGTTGNGGSTGAAGATGAAGKTGGDDSSGGCSTAAGAPASFGILLMALAFARARRRREKRR